MDQTRAGANKVERGGCGEALGMPDVPDLCGSSLSVHNYTQAPALLTCSSCRIAPATQLADSIAFCASCMEWALRAVESGAMDAEMMVRRWG